MDDRIPPRRSRRSKTQIIRFDLTKNEEIPRLKVIEDPEPADTAAHTAADANLKDDRAPEQEIREDTPPDATRDTAPMHRHDKDIQEARKTLSRIVQWLEATKYETGARSAREAEVLPSHHRRVPPAEGIVDRYPKKIEIPNRTFSFAEALKVFQR